MASRTDEIATELWNASSMMLGMRPAPEADTVAAAAAGSASSKPTQLTTSSEDSMEHEENDPSDWDTVHYRRYTTRRLKGELRSEREDSQCEETLFCLACQAARHISLDPNCPTRAFRATSPPLPKKNAAAKSSQGEQPEPLDKTTGTPPKTWSQVTVSNAGINISNVEDRLERFEQAQAASTEHTVQANPATQPRTKKHNELQRTPSTFNRKSSVKTDQALDTIMQLLEKLNSRMEATERAMAQQE
ncbi:hypothetical protein HPB52_021271 [Rhipicephalus sanguineus]|uniref:Uncharacterized protein n=1 Tax=Rhipicephalus sanguineus TaxID=34632 RepID=A0A9D4Q357_RHISA|nr:hypothetical protein HPB52_021271 [Rhipicephalus sanguineus]